MELIGREREIEALEGFYGGDAVKACAVYGRRRVGKTTLIREFMRGKPHLGFDLTGKVADVILDRAIETISEYDGRDMYEIRPTIGTFADLIRYIKKLEPGEKKMVVFLDELPDALKVFPDAAATLKAYIDDRLQEQNILLVVCGSSVSGMIEELNDGSKPLFRRFQVQLRISPLSYADSRRFHPGMSEDDRMRVYSIASGIPAYHLLMDGPSVEDGIKRNYLGISKPMLRDAESAIPREFTQWTSCEAVISAMAAGADRVKLISEKTGMSKANCDDILKKLETVGIIERFTPFGRGSRTVMYRITDGSILFYYSIILRNITLTESEDVDWAYSRMKESIDSFYGKRFETICLQFIALTERCLWRGTWAGRVPILDDDGNPVREDGRILTDDEDIDIVAKVDEGGVVRTLACECEFTRRRSGMRELDELRHRCRTAIPDRDNLGYVIFSRSGFTDELTEFAEDSEEVDVRLVSTDDMGRVLDSRSPQQAYKDA